MRRTTIMADDDTIERLKALARERGVSFAEVAREALDEKAAAYRPLPESLGAGSSGSGSRRTAATAGSRRTPPRSWR